MDANNLQQTNNFSDGMNTDTSDAFLSESSYRLANNLRFITNEQENSGELHMIEGTTASPDRTFNDETIIATTNLRDIPIYITQTNNKTHWKVYRDDECVAYIGKERNRVIDKRLSLVTRWEDEQNQKLYIADGEGSVIIIDLNPSVPPTELNQVVSYPAVTFKKPIFCGLIDGNIKASIVEYSYQFYKKHGQQSEISPSTKLIPLYKGATTAKESSKISGYLTEETSDKGVKIKITWDEKYTQIFDRIKIFRISYIEAGQLPQIECVYDENISGTELIFEDSGYKALSVHTLEEYNAMTGIHIIPKTIESKDDYLFAANVKDDNASFKVTDWDPKNIQLTPVTVDLIGDNTISPNIPISKPKHTTITTSRPSVQVYEIEQKTLSSEIQTSSGIFDLQDYIDTNNDVLSYHNPQVSYMFRSLRRGETYRFGIIFYDKYGRSSGVVHLEDICVDENNEFFDLANQQLVVKPLGVKFKITGSLPQDTVAYEIVRCAKSVSDVQTITQGFLSRPIAREYTSTEPVTKENYPLTPTGLVSIHDILWNVNDNSSSATNKTIAYNDYSFSGNKDIFQFISPEICYNQEYIKDILKNYELTITPIKYVCPEVFSTPNPQSQSQSISVDDKNSTQTIGRRVNYGNQYANITYHDTDMSIIHVDGYDTLFWDYVPYSQSENITINLSGEHDFEQNFYDAERRFAYAKLYYSYSGNEHPHNQQNNKTINEVLNNQYSISNVSFPETLAWDDFASSVADDSAELIYTDKVSSIGSKNFVNWVCGGLYGRILKGTSPYIKISELIDGTYQGIGTMGPGGKCMLIKVQDDNYDIVKSNPDFAIIGTYICNIKKKSILSDDDISKKNSTYRSFGDYFPVNQTEGYVFNGDCFIQPFEYIAQHKFAHPSSKFWRTACRVFVIPLETSINLAYTSGYEFNKEYNSASGDITYIQNNSGNVNNIFIQDTPLYVYNAVYSTVDTSRTYISNLVNEDDTDCLDYRVYHSNVKQNNEYVDSWLKYMPANFLDVDTRQGPITGLRTFKNQLIFWQEYATGALSINERSVISDESNMPLVLGSGGVLTRFDYITNTNGMHTDDYSDAQSNTTLYWWDRINKSVCGYSGGQDAIELSKIKFVQNYLNKNTPIQQPVVAYDNKSKEVIANVVDGQGHESGCLIYNEHLGHFTGLYTIDPKHKIELPDGLMLTTGQRSYKWNILGGDGNVYGLDGTRLYPYLKHVVNKGFVTTKVFDNAEFGGRVYGGDGDISYLKFAFSTPLKQYATLDGSNITNREYNFRYIIPRNEDSNGNQPQYGDRLRGKTMQCELWSDKNSYDLSLQYITTKFRASWS